MSESARPNPYSTDEILTKFKNYIETRKPGLRRFYNTDGPDGSLKGCATRGSDMTKKLVDRGCPMEVAAELSLLALWDLVVLIDNSISMEISEGGARAKTLAKTLSAISTVYSFARIEGIKAIRFLNNSAVYPNVTPKMITPLMKEMVFEGLTSIGTKLRDKVLVHYVTQDMQTPLLVIVLTDAEIEGETTGLLRDVIVSQAVKLQGEHGKDGPGVIGYQFAKIGNDQVAQDMVQRLDDDDKLRDYIDCMGKVHRLEDLVKKDRVWKILPKLLLGAISLYWDEEVDNPGGALENNDSELPSRRPKVEVELREDEEETPFFAVNNESETESGETSGGNEGVSNGGNPGSNISPPSNQAEAGPPAESAEDGYPPNGQSAITQTEGP